MLLDLDAFFASVEQLDHPAWRGKPVIVGGSAERRGVVSTCSYEARAFGVRSAMPASTARRLCPDAIWTGGDFARYREMSRRVMDVMRAESPVLQQVSIDEAFLDVTPGAYGRNDPVEAALRIQRGVAQLGITCSIGLGVSKAVAKTASEQDKPRGLTVVYPGREAAFLDPLPCARMSGIGPRAQEQLAAFHVRTLGEVARADEAVLARVFGKNAAMMRDRCLGRDDDPVSPEGAAPKSVSNEISFARDLESREDLEAAIATVAAKVCRRLRRNALAGATVALKVRFGDRSLRTAQRPLPRPSCDEFEIAPVLSELLDELWKPGMRVRLVGCAVSRFDGDASEQLGLFDDAPEQDAAAGRSKQLIAATDLVRDRFGEGAVRFGREMRTHGNLTGSAAKNPADYLSDDGAS